MFFFLSRDWSNMALQDPSIEQSRTKSLSLAGLVFQNIAVRNCP